MTNGSAEFTEGDIKEYPDLQLINVNPALNNEQMARAVFDATLSTNPKALILEAYGTGTTPQVLTPLIKEAVDKGVSVFLVSSNYGDEKGITKLDYEANMGAVGAGAVPLRDVNIRHMPKIMGTIQGEISSGKTGAELNQAVIAKFGTPVPQPPASK